MKLLESLGKKVDSHLQVRRYNLSEMISESYKVLYKCESGTNLHALVESHLKDVRNNPKDTERLSRQLSIVKEVVRLCESGEIKDKDLVSATSSEYEGDVEEKVEKEVEKRTSTEEVKESKTPGDEDLLEDDLTDEEVEELTKHLAEIRKNKVNEECDKARKNSVEETARPRKLKRSNESAALKESTEYRPATELGILNPLIGKGFATLDDLKYAILALKSIKVISTNKEFFILQAKDGSSLHYYKLYLKRAGSGYQVNLDSAAYREFIKQPTASTTVTYDGPAPTYESINLSEFSKKSSTKAFFKTLKKMQEKLKEGKALTRQESISLYKATNSAMTHLSVELEHNPEFLATFKESMSLLSIDASKVLGSLKEGKAPSKSTMKSLSKFVEALLREEEEEEDLPPIEDEEGDYVADGEGDISSEESEEFDQEYADARVELHKEMADKHAESDDLGVQERLAQDAEEVANLPGITDEQLAELATGEETPAEDSEAEDADEAKEPTNEKDLDLGDEEITDDELAELKKHLKEMRSSKS